jgi:hypothetical protein
LFVMVVVDLAVVVVCLCYSCLVCDDVVVL